MDDANIDDLVSFRPGDVVETTYGVGVVVALPSKNSSLKEDHDGDEGNDNDPDASLFYRVLLWRVPGRSIGTSTVSSLRRDTLLKKLPAAPGMVTTKKESQEASNVENGEIEIPQKYMVQAYYSNRHVYRIIPIGSDMGKKQGSSTGSHKNAIDTSTKRLSRLSIVSNFGKDDSSLPAVPEEVSVDDLAESAPCAKFYPLLVQLMERGNRASSATHNFISDNCNRDEVKELKKQVTGVAKQAAPYLKEQTQKNWLELEQGKVNDSNGYCRSGSAGSKTQGCRLGFRRQTCSQSKANC